MMKIDAELTIYTSSGEQINVDLSSMQTYIVLNILGIKFLDNDTYICFPDATLKQFLEFKGNPLHLREE